VPRSLGSRSKLFLLLGIIVAAGPLAAASQALHDGTARRVAFRVWRIVSPEAHGGGYVAVNGIRLYYETYGSGAPVLVLHGGLGSLEDMGPQIRAFAATRFVVAPDSRGQGRSTDAEAPLGYGLMADDMVRLLDALHLGRVDVVGWSDGGIIGLDLAIHHPDRIGRLVVIGANYDTAGLQALPAETTAVPPCPRFYARHAPDPAHWPVLYRKVITMWRTEPHDSLDELGRIRAPTLVIAGEFDAIRRDHTDQLAKAIPQAEETIVPGASHRLPSEQPGLVNARILRFLNAATS
jgi:pimeloyl-ACP methyl ester carboxylesterase